jgi:hypothetical protein
MTKTLGRTSVSRALGHTAIKDRDFVFTHYAP